MIFALLFPILYIHQNKQTWCKPCKEISPFYHKLATDYNATFVELDVDDMDEIASDMKVAMMPTFVVLRGKEKIASSTGAHQGSLETLIRQHVPRRP